MGARSTPGLGLSHRSVAGREGAAPLFQMRKRVCTGSPAVAHAHSAYHVGQITYLAKHWKGAEWKTLTVPKGQSEQFNAKMLEKYKTK